MKIILWGFMGAGKSTYAKELAECFAIKHIDLDTEIERISKKSILKIFESGSEEEGKESGEQIFRKLEQSVLQQCFKENENDSYIMSLGGGTVCNMDNYERILEQNPFTIYLKAVESDLIATLIEEQDSRPMLKSLTEDQIPNFVSTKLRERAVFYVKANMTISPRDLPAKDLFQYLSQNQFKAVLETSKN